MPIGLIIKYRTLLEISRQDLLSHIDILSERHSQLAQCRHVDPMKTFLIILWIIKILVFTIGQFPRLAIFLLRNGVGWISTFSGQRLLLSRELVNRSFKIYSSLRLCIVL